MKRRFIACLDIPYCSVEWHERTKQGWSTIKHNQDGTVVMFKPKDEETRPNILQIIRKNNKSS